VFEFQFFLNLLSKYLKQENTLPSLRLMTQHRMAPAHPVIRRYCEGTSGNGTVSARHQNSGNILWNVSRQIRSLEDVRLERNVPSYQAPVNGILQLSSSIWHKLYSLYSYGTIRLHAKVTNAEFWILYYGNNELLTAKVIPCDTVIHEKRKGGFWKMSCRKAKKIKGYY
jgi:hypothetical protein